MAKGDAMAKLILEFPEASEKSRNEIAALRARIAELEVALEGLVAEVDDRSYKEGCGCDWCGSIRRARRALESDHGDKDG